MRGLPKAMAGIGLAGVVVGAAGLVLRAQDEEPRRPASAEPARAVGRGRIDLEEAMLRPFTWPFAKETTLDEAVHHLKTTLGAAVVLDLAALKRRDLTPEVTVRLELDGVRLKTGLKLLLDQVGLTWKIVPEDNLLILTDAEGADDPSNKILAELRTLHREIHELRDFVDELAQELAPIEEPGGAVIRKPTIIEEMPGEKAKENPKSRPPEDDPAARSRPGS